MPIHSKPIPKLTPKQSRNFWKKVNKETDSGCWDWTGYKNSEEYGRFYIAHGKGERSIFLAHRIAYSELVASIPEGMVIDHKCKNHSCVNPDHLDVVTIKENVLRGDGPTAKNARKETCIHGHPLTDDNVYLEHNKNGSVYRKCRACRREVEEMRSEAFRKAKRKPNPSPEELQRLLDENVGLTAIALEYGVTYAAVRKWVKRLEAGEYNNLTYRNKNKKRTKRKHKSQKKPYHKK